VLPGFALREVSAITMIVPIAMIERATAKRPTSSEIRALDAARLGAWGAFDERCFVVANASS
jgi:hypothetical protein